MLQSFINFLGIALILGATLQLILWILSFFQKRYTEKKRSQQSLESLSANISLAKQKARKQNNSTVAWEGFRKFVVTKKVEEIEGVFSFYLQAQDKRPLPPYLPGQHLVFSFKIPGKKKRVIRCYSLSDAPQADTYRITVKKIGLASGFLADTIVEGCVLDAKAPAGSFVLDNTSQAPAVLIAGGIGLTPLLSMLLDATASGSKRQIFFLYGVGNGKNHAMKATLKEIAQAHPNITLLSFYNDPLDTDEEGRDYDHKGNISVDFLKTLLPSKNCQFYICGPPPMMKAVISDLKAWGAPEQSVFFEAFNPESLRDILSTVDDTDENVSYSVTFHLSNKSLTWTGEHNSLLDFAEENDIEIESGCRAGNCQTCAVTVTEGTVKYPIPPGCGVEDGTCLTCCCVPTSDLKLKD